MCSCWYKLLCVCVCVHVPVRVFVCTLPISTKFRKIAYRLDRSLAKINVTYFLRLCVCVIGMSKSVTECLASACILYYILIFLLLGYFFCIFVSVCVCLCGCSESLAIWLLISCSRLLLHKILYTRGQVVRFSNRNWDAWSIFEIKKSS